RRSSTDLNGTGRADGPPRPLRPRRPRRSLQSAPVGHGRDTLRTAALVATGWWAVHQLRYLLPYGAGSGDALHQTAHPHLRPARLGPVAPLPGMALVLVFARMVVRATAAPAGRSARTQRLIVLWPACAGAIALLYAAQETTEGVLAAGHPTGLAAVFGGGGWL